MEILIIPAIVILFFLIIPGIIPNKKDCQLKEERQKSGITSEMFFQHFVEKGVNKEWYIFVYNDVQQIKRPFLSMFKKRIIEESFPVMPTDSLSKIYGIDNDLLYKTDTIICLVEGYLKRSLSKKEKLKLIDVIWDNAEKLSTVSDLILILWEYLQNFEKDKDNSANAGSKGK